jgi:hypothetical protein
LARWLVAEKLALRVKLFCGRFPERISKTCILIFRFENTVTAIFNGHTHNDHFHVYYATDELTRPISVAVNGGSVTPFSDLNSNYKIYTVDSVTYVSISDVKRIQICNAVIIHRKLCKVYTAKCYYTELVLSGHFIT